MEWKGSALEGKERIRRGSGIFPEIPPFHFPNRLVIRPRPVDGGGFWLTGGTPVPRGRCIRNGGQWLGPL